MNHMPPARKKEGVKELERLLQSPRIPQRADAAFRLGGTGRISAIKPLGSALSDESSVVRHTAVFSLARIGGPKALRLVATALADEDEKVVSRARGILEMHGPAAFPPLAEMLGHKEETVRKSALNILEQLANKLKSEKSADEKVRAYFLVQQHFRPEETAEVRYRAIQSAIRGEINEKNARLYVKQLRAMKGILK